MAKSRDQDVRLGGIERSGFGVSVGAKKCPYENVRIIGVAGSFQTEFSCFPDWQPAGSALAIPAGCDLKTLLQHQPRVGAKKQFSASIAPHA